MGSFLFDGTDDYMKLAAAPVAGSVPLTVAAWVKPGNPFSRSITHVGTDGIHEHFQRLLWNNQEFQAVTRTTGSSVARALADWTANAWNSAVAVWAATNDRSVFNNGGSKGTNSTNRTVNPPDSLYVGSTSILSDFLDGHLGYLFIWDVALTDQEVLDWHNGSIPQQANLVEWWDFTSDPGGATIVGQLGVHTLTINGPTFDSLESPSVVYGGGGGATVFGSASLAMTASIETAAKKKAYGASESVLTASVATAGKKTAHAGASLPMTLSTATTAKKKAHGSTTVPITFTIDTSGTVPLGTTVFGSASLALTFGSTTTGKRTAQGAASLPVTVTTTTSAKKTARGAVSSGFSLLVDVAGTVFSVAAQAAQAAAARRMERTWRLAARRDIRR